MVDHGLVPPARSLWSFFAGFTAGLATGLLVAIGIFNPSRTTAVRPGDSAVEGGPRYDVPSTLITGSELFSPDRESGEREAADTDITEARKRTDDFISNLYTCGGCGD